MSNINEKNLGPRWYVVHTYSGYENKVKASIEKIVENRGLGHLIFDLQIPVEKTVVEMENGETKEVENKIFPAYVLVKMVMTDESWHVVRNVTGVTGFVGPGSEPVPLTEKEVAFFHIEHHEPAHKFTVGDKIKVVSGDFAGYGGAISDIDEAEGMVTFLAVTARREIPLVVSIKDIAPDDGN